MEETPFSNSDFDCVSVSSSLHISFIFCLVHVTFATKFGCIARPNRCFPAFMPFLMPFLWLLQGVGEMPAFYRMEGLRGR